MMISGFGPEQMINGGTDTGENEGEAGLVGVWKSVVLF